jgi:hypothetical protein
MKTISAVLISLALIAPAVFSAPAFSWTQLSNTSYSHLDEDLINYVAAKNFWVEITGVNGTNTYTPISNLTTFTPLAETNPTLNSSFYAVANGCFYLSTYFTCNGSTWINLEQPIYDIAFGNNVSIVLVSNETGNYTQTSIYSTHNGTNMIFITTLNETSLSVEFAYDAFFVMNSKGFVGQYNNHTYTQINGIFPAELSKFGLAFGDKVWVGLLENYTTISTANVSNIGAASANNITVNNSTVYDFGFWDGYFIISNDVNGNPIYSADGVSWSEMGPSNANLTINSYVDQVFYAYSYNKTNSVATVYTSTVDFIGPGSGISWYVIVIVLVAIGGFGFVIYECLMKSYKYHVSCFSFFNFVE